MELQKTETHRTQVAPSETPTLQMALRYPKKYPLAPYLPEKLRSSLSQMKAAEITETSLRNADFNTKNIFIHRMLSLINPKFEEESEMKIAKMELQDFANKCELTPKEVLLAVEMCIDGRLYSEPNESGFSERLRLFREIDRIKLGEIKSAYIYQKTINKQYEADTEKIKAYLQSSQQSEESKKQKAKEDKQKAYEEMIKQTQAGNVCRHGFLFYKEFSQNEDFPDKNKTSEEKWKRIFETIQRIIYKEKSNRNSIFSAQDIKAIENIIQQDFDAFFVQRNSPTLTRIKTFAIKQIQNESVFNYLKSKQNETHHRPEKSPHGGVQKQETK